MDLVTGEITLQELSKIREAKSGVSLEHAVSPLRLRRVWREDGTPSLSFDCLWPRSRRGRAIQRDVEVWFRERVRGERPNNGLCSEILPERLERRRTHRGDVEAALQEWKAGGTRSNYYGTLQNYVTQATDRSGIREEYRGLFEYNGDREGRPCGTGRAGGNVPPGEG